MTVSRTRRLTPARADDLEPTPPRVRPCSLSVSCSAFLGFLDHQQIVATAGSEQASASLVAPVSIGRYARRRVPDINVFVRHSQRSAERVAVGLALVRQQVNAGKL